jgi:hypothetical protein
LLAFSKQLTVFDEIGEGLFSLGYIVAVPRQLCDVLALVFYPPIFIGNAI